MNVLIIGGGNMGQTFAKAFLKSHIIQKENLWILEKSESNATKIAALDIGKVYSLPDKYISKADLIILAVKPQDSDSLFVRINPYLDSQQLILSIMAGVTIKTIQEGLGIQKVIRVMPNLPAQIGVGMSVFTSSEEVTRIELITVQNLLNNTGKSFYCEGEEMIDASTAISGSGPAYVFYFMSTMIDQAMKFGFSLAEAELLTYQTFRGSIELYQKSDFTCDEWIQKVTSKGGTTEAAFKIFIKEEVSKSFESAMNIAYLRAKELSGLSK